jgi:hypothetical protein
VRRHWRGGAALLALTVGALAACSNANARPAATIDDPTFVRQANSVCRGTVPALRAPDRKNTSTTIVVGERVDAVANGLAAVLVKLKTIPVRETDAGRVKAWLDDWGRFIDVGHQYAAAVRAQQPDRYTKIDDEAVRLAKRMGRFARGNRIDSCLL